MDAQDHVVVANDLNVVTNNHDAMHGICCAHYVLVFFNIKMMAKDHKMSMLWVLCDTNKRP